jgi:hypothetical protein
VRMLGRAQLLYEPSVVEAVVATRAAVQATVWPAQTAIAWRGEADVPALPEAYDEYRAKVRSIVRGASVADGEQPLPIPAPPVAVTGVATCALPPGFIVDPDTNVSRPRVQDDEHREYEALQKEMQKLKEHGGALGDAERKERAAALTLKLADMIGLDGTEED